MSTFFVKTPEAARMLSLSSYAEWKSFARAVVSNTANRPESLYVVAALLCGCEL